jgi:hypothetical protein
LDHAYRLQDEPFLVGEVFAVYVLEKARRLGGSLALEWSGSSNSECMAGVVRTLRDASPQRTCVALKPRSELLGFFENLDERLEDSSGDATREMLQSSGVSWKQWCAAGTGWAARSGLERLYF